MKTLSFLLLLIASIQLSQAQSFEGTISWKFESNMKVSDEQREQIAAARKQLEARMNDPEFKKQLEQNPQLKKMIEQQLKMQNSGGDPLAGIFPEHMLIKIKGNKSRTIINDSKELLYDGASGKNYELNPSDKTYREAAPTSNENLERMKKSVTITKTNETATIAGYSCNKFIVVYTDPQLTGGKEATQYMWVTKELSDIDQQFMKHTNQGAQNMGWLYDKIDGIPLKIEINTGQFAITMQVEEVKHTSLPDSDFVIPSNYTVAPH